MPTRIEQSRLYHGYRLPEGLSWAKVAERRERWRIEPIFVPAVSECRMSAESR